MPFRKSANAWGKWLKKTSRINLNCFDDTTWASVFANAGGGWDRIDTCSALVAVQQHTSSAEARRNGMLGEESARLVPWQ